jgi:hypothetical protein
VVHRESDRARDPAHDLSALCSELAAQLHCVPERSISLNSSSLNARIERVVQLLEESVMAAKKKGKKKKK